ncbi:aquaporin-8-like [Xenia sp. Carnegie-2017]|uniref:aquaporin-8-like n=1 Tax=Xenia sp. Carnegie-2017 TaxID=2897299 RepID=UPI001F035101|nr:aquaporin-8-like [Xenia sp. Carnegie-2017]
MEDHRFTIEEQPPRSQFESSLFFKYIQPCIAEMFGTILIVYIDICLGKYSAFVHGYLIFALIAATSSVSGGCFNPVVTLALTIFRGIQPVLALLFIISQILGGIIGAALARAAMSSKDYKENLGGVRTLGGVRALDPYSTLHPYRTQGTDINPGQGILAEALATSILVLVVLMVLLDERNKSKLAPLAIGLSVVGGIAANLQITGGSMNPVRSFGAAVVKNSWKHHYVYWVGPFLGGMLSTLMYGFVLASPNQLWLVC